MLRISAGFLNQIGLGIGALGIDVINNNLFAAKNTKPHFRPTAKSIIYLHMVVPHHNSIFFLTIELSKPQWPEVPDHMFK